MKGILFGLAMFFSVILLVDVSIIGINFYNAYKLKKDYEKGLWPEIIMLLLSCIFWGLFLF